MLKQRWRKIVILLVMGVILTICGVVIWTGNEIRRELEAMVPPVTPCPTFECTPNPNSHRIAFSSDRFEQGQEIYTMNANGTCVTQLTDFSDWFIEKEAVRPTWSPNGTEILFELHRDEDSSAIDLYTVSVDRKQIKRLTQNGRNCDARWAPDGSKIAFKSGRDGSTLLHIMNADGSEERRLTDIPTLDCRDWRLDAQEWGYDWSPDGRKIVFTGIESENGRQDVHIVDVENSEVINVTNQPSS